MKVKVEHIKTVPPFNSLFDINPDTLRAVTASIEADGYDESAPIVTWKKTVIDGHTRLRAAIEAGLEEVPVHERDFSSEDEALAYAIHNQRDRRNLSPGELLRVVELVDKRKPHGGNMSEAPTGATLPGKTCYTTAQAVGISSRQVERVRTVLDEPEMREAVERGEKSIRQADIEIREQRRLSRPTFNATNENIEWAKWSWNPVTGCKHGCPYCYARDIANRFNPRGFEPAFHKDRLNAPADTKIPESRKDEPGIHNVFVCSMADLLGKWVPRKWIDPVIKAVAENPQWQFLFLTKNPARYQEFVWPDNAWLGATADTQARMDAAVEALRDVEASIKFLSSEPLLEPIEADLEGIDWLIIGSRSKSSGLPAFQPPWAWVEGLMNCARRADVPVYCKPNLQVMIRDYPKKER